MDQVKNEKLPVASPLGSLPIIIIAAVAAVVLIQALTFAGISYFISDWGHRGQFGDLFGVTNSLFSGLASAGLVYTIFLQHRQIRDHAIDSSRAEREFQENSGLTRSSLECSEQQLKLADQSHRLNTVTNLLEYYSREIDRLNDLESRKLGPANIDQRKVDLTNKTVNLRKIVDNAYIEIAA